MECEEQQFHSDSKEAMRDVDENQSRGDSDDDDADEEKRKEAKGQQTEAKEDGDGHGARKRKLSGSSKLPTSKREKAIHRRPAAATDSPK